MNTRRALILDLEAACDGSASPACVVPRGEMETSEFGTMMLDVRRGGVGRALPHCQLHLQGTPHRAIDDARNIARLVTVTLALDA